MHRGQRASLGNQTDHAIKAGYKRAADFFATRHKFLLLPGGHPYKGNMAVHTFSSRDFTRDVSAAKRAAVDGPVFITDRGKPAHVLLSFNDYQKLTKQRRNIADALAMPGIADIEFEPPRVTIQSRPADFS